MQTMVEMGQKVYTAIFKRVWRSLKEEYKKMYRLNSIHLPVWKTGPDGLKVTVMDFQGNPDNIRPVADPHLVDERSQKEQAAMLLQASQTMPGFDKEKVTKRWLKAMRVDGIDQIYPGVAKTGPLPNPKVQVEQMKLQLGEKKLALEKMEFAAQLQEDMKVNQATIIKLHAESAALMAGVDADKRGHEIAALELQLGFLKAHNEAAKGRIDQLLKGIELDQQKQTADADRAAMGGAEGESKSDGGSDTNVGASDA
jgi:hypothetical protein